VGVSAQQTTYMYHQCMLVAAVLVLLITTGRAADQPGDLPLSLSGSTAYVAQQATGCPADLSPCVTFRQALANQSLSTLLLTESVSISPGQHPSTAFVITRDVLVSSYQPDALYAIDFNYVGGVAVLGPGNTLTFEDVQVKGMRWVGTGGVAVRIRDGLGLAWLCEDDGLASGNGGRPIHVVAVGAACCCEKSQMRYAPLFSWRC